MKKLLLALSLVLLAGSIVWAFAPAHMTRETAVHIGVGDADCNQEGYLTPPDISVNKGDTVKVKFINDQANAVMVRDTPSGSFVLAGNDSVTKKFTVDKDCKYSVWLKDTCQVAKGSISITTASRNKVNYIAIGIFALLSASLAWINWGSKPAKFSRRK